MLFWIYIIFPAMVLVIDYITYQRNRAGRGSLMNFWITAAAIGLLIMGLPFLVQNNVIQYPAQNITSSSGNTLIAAYNVTVSPNNNTTSYMLLLGELLVFIQLAYALLQLVYIFKERRKSRYQ